jgi:hypothetical protein
LFVCDSDQRVRRASAKRLRIDPGVKYAIFTQQGVSLVDDREPTTLVWSERLGVVLVRLEEPPERG